jgi:hypothetical protein
MPHLFSGLNQKKFNNSFSTTAVNMGSTKGRGSTTRMLNYCRQKSQTPSECINQFININNQTNVDEIDEIDVIINLYNALSANFIDEFDNLVTKYNL